MTTPTPQPPAPAPPAGPAEPADKGFFGHIHLPGHGTPAPPAGTEAETILRGHGVALIRSVADLLEQHPGAEPAASKVLEVAVGILKAAGVSL